jgi:hypothetical protein
MTVSKVRPYRAVGRRRGGGAYHDRADCPIGREIHSEELTAGAGSRPYCDVCRELNAARLPDRPADASPG